MLMQVIYYILLFTTSQITTMKLYKDKMKENCYCVLPELCLDEDHTLLDPRDNLNYCEHLTEVCCRFVVDIEAPLPPLVPPGGAPGPGRGCGVGKAGDDLPSERITDSHRSQYAKRGELPWTAIIFGEHPPAARCGGALIHPNVVLTAAHCVRQKLRHPPIFARVGQLNVSSPAAGGRHRDNVAHDVAVHPLYDALTLANDIALLFFLEPFVLSADVGTVCLAAGGADEVDGAQCVASGWGRSSLAGGGYSPALRKVHVPVVAADACVAQLRRTRLGAYFRLHESFMCAGGRRDEDACEGDGGGPLVCPVRGAAAARYVQVGIVSWGIGCGGNAIPGVYVAVNRFMDWIDNQMFEKGLDSGFYKSE